MLVSKSESKHPLTETNEIKVAYNDMYTALSQFIWGFPVVGALVDVEIEAYKAFPDLETLRGRIDTLKSEIRHESRDADEAIDAVDIFKKAVDDVDTVYAKLKVPREVLV